MRDGYTMEEIEDYMQQQSDEYSLAISENYNGIYGLINGKYLDGTGWKPGKSIREGLPGPIISPFQRFPGMSGPGPSFP